VLMASDGGARSIPDGPQRRIFFSGESQPTVAGEFNRIGISLDQTLQNGDYEVVGASVRNTGSVAFGLDFEDRSGV